MFLGNPMAVKPFSSASAVIYSTDCLLADTLLHAGAKTSSVVQRLIFQHLAMETKGLNLLLFFHFVNKT
jgi:hypothetical protein